MCCRNYLSSLKCLFDVAIILIVITIIIIIIIYLFIYLTPSEVCIDQRV